MNREARISVKLVDGCDLPPPHRETDGSAGFDLRSRVALDIYPGQRVMVPTGYCWEIEPGSVGLICPRSGLAIKHGISVINAPGVIDSDYRGEVCVLLVNMDFDYETGVPGGLARMHPRPFHINVGDRIAQMVVLPVKALAKMSEAVNYLGDTERGIGGFGSTGAA